MAYTAKDMPPPPWRLMLTETISWKLENQSVDPLPQGEWVKNIYFSIIHPVDPSLLYNNFEHTNLSLF